MKALLLVCFVLVSLSSGGGRVWANPWSAQPNVGLVTEYVSNPPLIPGDSRSETHEVLLLDLPMNYDEDSLHFSATPHIRYSDKSGYASLASNYYHLDTVAQFLSDRGSLSVHGSQSLDSSLQYAVGPFNGIGVRRDTSVVAVDWQYALSERAQFQTDASTSRTLFSARNAAPNLVDYRYSSASPTFACSINERNTLRILGGPSRYYALDDSTSSNSVNLQLGLDRRLSEFWTLSGSAGYSKSTDQYRLIAYKYAGGSYFPASEILKTHQNSAVYSATLTRQDEVIGVTTGVSRSLAPSGLAFLTRQDVISMSVNYAYSERWTFNAGLNWQRLAAPPLVAGGIGNRTFYDADLSAQWHWTEQWTVVLHATKIGQQYGRPAVSATSNGLSIAIYRQFYRTNN